MNGLQQRIEYYRLQLAKLLEQKGHFLEPEILAKSRKLDKALNEFMRMQFPEGFR